MHTIESAYVLACRIIKKVRYRQICTPLKVHMWMYAGSKYLQIHADTNSLQEWISDCIRMYLC
jgi:hypothetical protein